MHMRYLVPPLVHVNQQSIIRSLIVSQCLDFGIENIQVIPLRIQLLHKPLIMIEEKSRIDLQYSCALMTNIMNLISQHKKNRGLEEYDG